MHLFVDRLSGTPTTFRYEPGSAWQQAARSLPELEGSQLGFEVTAHRMGADLYLEGVAAGVLELTCGRCANRYRHALREAFRLVLEPAGDRVPADPEAAEALARDGLWLTDELEAGHYRGNVLDLGGFLREAILLALPVQALCRSDCRGLCPHCGVDRNVESCECEQVARSSPFAVLGSLRTKR